MVRAEVVRTIAVTAIAILAACKDKQDKPASGNPAPITQPAGSAGSAAPTPRLPSTPATPSEPVSIEEAQKVLPPIVGPQVIGLKQTSDKRQVHGTWCIDGDSADGVARLVGRWMADAGYTDLGIRGDARKAGVSGDRDGFRMSMVVSASGAASCAAPQHYFASATIFRP